MAAPKGHVITALQESGFADDAKKLVAGTKSAAWKKALQVVPKTGWLPPQLRASSYSGPGSSKKKARK